MIVRKTKGELDLMDDANRIVHQVLDLLEQTVAPASYCRRSQAASSGQRPRGSKSGPTAMSPTTITPASARPP